MKRHLHNLSHTKIASLQMGELTPISVLEVLPGDSFKCSSAMLLRMAPLNTPVMSAFDVHIHYWFVPNRIVWNSWEAFIVNDETATLVPKVTYANTTPSNQQYFAQLMETGTPYGFQGTWSHTCNTLPLRAYNLIWNEFYRDQDIGALAPLSLADTGDAASDFVLRNVAWRKDYLTVARTKPQKGAGGTVTVSSSAFTVEQFRVAAAKQSIEEHRNRFGSRYTDYLRFLGITPSDARLQRPEYLGGGKQTVSVSEVLTTSNATGGRTGEMAGHGIAALRSKPFKRFFEEHGFVLALAFVRPQAVYGSLKRRFYNYSSPGDFWQKENELKGMQAITNNELWVPGAGGTNAFGWVGRDDHYRHVPSTVAGFLTQPAYQSWSVSRMWTTLPTLVEDFIACKPSRRVLQDQSASAPDFFFMSANHVLARRLVSKYPRH